MVWYVEYNKIGHIDPEIVTNEIKIIEKLFRKYLLQEGMMYIFVQVAKKYTLKTHERPVTIRH